MDAGSAIRSLALQKKCGHRKRVDGNRQGIKVEKYAKVGWKTGIAINPSDEGKWKNFAPTEVAKFSIGSEF
jgi:hypothetical protein